MLVPGDVFEHAREQEMKALDPLYAPSRYEKDFEEMGILGRGGYGTVATARHRIDGQDYAVKRFCICVYICIVCVCVCVCVCLRVSVCVYINTHTHTPHTHTHIYIYIYIYIYTYV